MDRWMEIFRVSYILILQGVVGLDFWLKYATIIRQDTIDGMSVAIDELRAKLASDPIYFKEVYNQTFEAMKQDNQRYLSAFTQLE